MAYPRPFGHLMGHNMLLGMLLVIITAAQFLLYERTVGALEQLTLSGIAPLRAFGYVLVVVTVGSPMLFVAGLQHGLSIQGLPLLGTAAANTCLLVLLVRNCCAWIYHRFLMARTTR
jgi:hypothetical protein